ncbi:MAG TPA: GAF domain-containing protein [Terriglobales bacterium]|nr:GAF domain-containing protein [Terriglobales bacterium]
MLSLSRVLGGSIREHARVPRVMGDELIDRVVEDILQRNTGREFIAEASTLFLHTNQNLLSPAVSCRILPNALPQLQPAMRWVVERGCTITRADGAALALSRHGKLVCHAQTGSSPDLGTEIELSRGISGLCARTGVSWRCDSSDTDPYVDRNRCRDLGTQSVMAAPVSHLNSVLGVLEVFSRHKNAFTDHDAAALQLLSGLLVVAITRGGVGTPVEATALAGSRVR